MFHSTRRRHLYRQWYSSKKEASPDTVQQTVQKYSIAVVVTNVTHCPLTVKSWTMGRGFTRPMSIWKSSKNTRYSCPWLLHEKIRYFEPSRPYFVTFSLCVGIRLSESKPLARVWLKVAERARHPTAQCVDRLFSGLFCPSEAILRHASHLASSKKNPTAIQMCGKYYFK